MSLNRISFLEGWERTPAFLRRDSASAHSDETDSYVSLPEPASPLSSSFPSTYSRLNFNPYAGPGWHKTAEQHDDRPGLSPTTTRDRRGTAQAVPEAGAGNGVAVLPKEPSGWPDTRGAFEVSPVKRVVQVCLAVAYCFLAAGIVFGFAALKPILIRENAYRDLCSKEELDEDVLVCDGQEIRLNLMFTIAAVATNVFALPVGTILDAYGPRVSSLIGSLCLAIGATFFASASRLPFDGYIPGYLFLSLGGPFVFISSFHLSNTFPTRSGLILSMLTGAFDASSALFLIFRLLNEHTEGYVSTQTFFLTYLLVPAFIALVQVTIMPATSYKTAGELVQQAEAQVTAEMNDHIDETIRDGEQARDDRRIRRESIVQQIQGLLNTEPTPVDTLGIDNTTSHQPPSHPEHPPIPPNKPTPQKSGIYGILHGQSALHQLQTPWFILITLFTALMMLRINYFVATLYQQYSTLLTPRQAQTLNKTFDILLPAGGLLSIPFTGTILDTLQTRTVLSILVSAATAIGVLGCIRASVPAAYANIALFVLYRPFYYTAVSDYAAKVFGFVTFGKVYGLVICLAGVGNFAQAGLDAVTLGLFRGDPVPVNVGLTVAVGVVGVVLVGFVWWRTEMGGLPAGGGLAESAGRGRDDVVRDWERWPLLREGDRAQREMGYGS